MLLLAFAIPTVCALFALAVRVWRLGAKSLWIDEALSWNSARLSFFPMTRAASGHHDGPLYYATLSVWIKAAGDSEVALRLPSALAGALTVFVLAWAGWRVGGRLLGAVAGVLLALNVVAVQFSQEARMYPLTGLLALGASVALALFVARPTALRLAGYSVLAIGLVYAHYSGWVVLGLHATLFVAYGSLYLWTRRDARVLAGGAASAVLIGIAYIPWYSNFLRSADAGVPIVDPDRDIVASVLRSSLGLEHVGQFWPFIAAALIFLAILGIARRLDDPMVVCVAAIAFVPLAMLFISLVRTPVFNLKQISPYIAGVCFVIALGVVEAGWLVGRLAPSRLAVCVSLAAAALIAGSAARATLDWYDAPPVEDWHGAAASLRNNPHEPVYIWQFFADLAARYYLDPNTPKQLLTPPLVAATADGYVPVVSSRLDGRSTLMLSHSLPSETTAILGSLRPYFSITEPTVYSGVQVYSLRANTLAEFNVALDASPGAWTGTPDGYLQSGEHALFSLRSGALDAPFSLHVEYLDARSGALSVSLPSPSEIPSALATMPLTGSNEWRTIDVPIAHSPAMGRKFVISPGATIRSLEMRRYDLQATTAFVRTGASSASGFSEGTGIWRRSALPSASRQLNRSTSPARRR